MSLTWTYTAPEGAATSITVTYNTGEWTHVREVNAVFDSEGVYDADATETRVAQVGMGVQEKIKVGVLNAPDPDPVEPTADPAAEESP